MNKLKYFLQFLGIIFLFTLFRILGLKISSILSGIILSFLGPLFRSNKISLHNLSLAFPNLDNEKKKRLLKKMWINYGKILSEYIFLKNFRNSPKYWKKIFIENKSILEKIKNQKEPVVFISGHFNNFELMAMQIEKAGVNLAAVYRPLNNIFLNPIMEKIRTKYICKNQIKKGIPGAKQLVKYFRNKTSVALMIDQRVSEGIKSNFFDKAALTTTLPAQFVKKFNAKIVPIYIERTNDDNFKLNIFDPIEFKEKESIESITLNLNKILEKMITRNPDQWIWTHNRWK